MPQVKPAQTLFGAPSPWASDSPLENHAAANTDLKETVIAPTDKTKAAAIGKNCEGIEEGLRLISLKLTKQFEEKGRALHTEIKAKEKTIKLIDEFTSLLLSRSQTNADGTVNRSGNVDCADPEIVRLATVLRESGVSVALPRGNISPAERGALLNNIQNQRSLVSDELREKAQEFQQCVVEQNSMFQMLMSIAETWHRIMMKWISLIYNKNNHG